MPTNRRRPLRAESLEPRWLLAGDCLQNPLDHADINNDGNVTGEDIAVVLNHLVLENEGRELPQRYAFLDADGSRSVGSGDIASVVGRIIVDSQRPDDSLEQRLTQMAGRNSVLGSMVEQYRAADEPRTATLGRMLQVGDGEAPLREQLESLLGEHEQFEQQLREQLDAVIGSAADFGEQVIDDVQRQFSEARFGVDNRLAEHLEDRLGEHRLQQRVNDLLERIGATDIGGEVRDFLDQVESGTLQVPASVTDLLEQFRDRLPTLPDDLTAVIDSFDADALRTSVTDLLDALEDEGVALPERVTEFRDALLSGETPLADFVNRWIDELRDQTGSLQDLIDEALGELADVQWTLPDWLRFV